MLTLATIIGESVVAAAPSICEPEARAPIVTPSRMIVIDAAAFVRASASNAAFVAPSAGAGSAGTGTVAVVVDGGVADAGIVDGGAVAMDVVVVPVVDGVGAAGVVVLVVVDVVDAVSAAVSVVSGTTIVVVVDGVVVATVVATVIEALVLDGGEGGVAVTSGSDVELSARGSAPGTAPLAPAPHAVRRAAHAVTTARCRLPLLFCTTRA